MIWLYNVYILPYDHDHSDLTKSQSNNTDIYKQ
jgi:hypothetical protein